MAIQIIKLVTGEDVVGDVETSDDVYSVKSPLKLAMRPNPDKVGSFKLSVEPWAPYAKEATVSILKSSVVAIFDPDDIISKEYETRGVWLPTKNTEEAQLLNEEETGAH